MISAAVALVLIAGPGCRRGALGDGSEGGGAGSGGLGGAGGNGGSGAGAIGTAGATGNTAGAPVAGATGTAGTAGSAGATGMAGAGGSAGATGRGGGAGSGPRSLSFLAPVVYQTHTQWGVALGDLNGDEWPDIAVASDGLGNPARNGNILLNDGRGRFTPTTGFTAMLRSIALGDLNGDGRLDIVGSGPRVLYNNGDATFGDPVAIATHTPNADAIAVADLNGDGHPDLAAAGIADPSGAGVISVLVGDGRGDFRLTPGYPIAGGSYSIAPGDVDGDGDTDLVVSGDSHDLIVLVNRGDATFEPAVYMVWSSYDVALADLDGDGRPEVAVAGNGDIRTMHNNGDGTFTAPVGSSSVAPIMVTAGDLDGDGRVDLVVGESSRLYVMRNLGDSLAKPMSLPAGAWSAEIGDVNGDGKPDIVAGALGIGVTVLINSGS